MNYQHGLDNLKSQLKVHGSDQLAGLETLADRLVQNERQERLFGSSENIRNEHSQIIFALNKLALDFCGISFNKLCEDLPPKDPPIELSNTEPPTQIGGSNAPFQNQQLSANNYENAVFVSYAWGGESERMVDELEQAFAKRGIRVARDKKEIGYKSSIEAFERRIGQGQCIVLVISDKYLRSEHCMYELVEVDKNRNLRDRIFPIVLADAHIYKAVKRLSYVKYWDEQIEQLNQAIKEVNVIANLSGFTADLDKYASIRASFDHLTDLLSDMNVLTTEMHAVNGFSNLIGAVERAMAENKTRPDINITRL